MWHGIQRAAAPTYLCGLYFKRVAVADHWLASQCKAARLSISFPLFSLKTEKGKDSLKIYVERAPHATPNKALEQSTHAADAHSTTWLANSAFHGAYTFRDVHIERDL